MATLSQRQGVTEIGLRPATPGDYDFLYELHRAALGPYIAATWGWDEPWQRRTFRRHLESPRQIVIEEAKRIGSLSLIRRRDCDYLAYLALLPAHHGRGLGTRLIARLMVRAEARGLPLRLRVLKVNPARRLYDRLGFAVTGEDAVSWVMQWHPHRPCQKPPGARR